MKTPKKFTDVDNSLPSYDLDSLDLDNFIAQSLSPPFSFNFLLEPGLYAIVKTKIKKYYIGEAQSVARRVGDLFSKLRCGSHICSELQKDWNLHGEPCFIFIVLDIGIGSWSNRIQRCKTEELHIQKNQPNVYNHFKVGNGPTSLFRRRFNDYP